MTTEPVAIPADMMEACPFCGGEAKIIEGEECAYVQCARWHQAKERARQADEKFQRAVAELRASIGDYQS